VKRGDFIERYYNNEENGIALIDKDNESRQGLIHIVLFIATALCFGIAIASNKEYGRQPITSTDNIISCGDLSRNDRPPYKKGNSCPHQSPSQGILAFVTSQKNRLFRLNTCCIT
jgi:hypothetical protein